MIPTALVSLLFFSLCTLGCRRPVAEPSAGNAQVKQESHAPAVRASKSSADIREAYTRFVQALQSRNGPGAADLVSKRTINLYARCRSVALDSSGIDLEELSQFEVLLVMQLRYLLTRRELKSMSGRDVFCWGVGEGMVKLDTVEGIALDKVQVDSDVAFATLRKAGQPVGSAAFRFVNENAGWKFDLYYIGQAMEPVFQKLRSEASKSKIELAIFLLERTYAQEIPFDILNGPLR